MTLFGQPVDEPTTGGARRSDPASSREAARNRASIIRWGTQRTKLLAAYASPQAQRDGGMTDEAAGRYAGVGRVADTRRCSELRTADFIVPTGKFGVTSTESAAMICAITSAGRKALTEALAAKVRLDRPEDPEAAALPVVALEDPIGWAESLGIPFAGEAS